MLTLPSPGVSSLCARDPRLPEVGVHSQALAGVGDNMSSHWAFGRPRPPGELDGQLPYVSRDPVPCSKGAVVTFLSPRHDGELAFVAGVQRGGRTLAPAPSACSSLPSVLTVEFRDTPSHLFLLSDVPLYGRSATLLPLGAFAQDICVQPGHRRGGERGRRGGFRRGGPAWEEQGGIDCICVPDCAVTCSQNCLF